MTNSVIALIVAAGIAGWVYNKMMRSTGSNSKNSLVVATVAGVFAFVILLIAFNLIPS